MGVKNLGGREKGRRGRKVQATGDRGGLDTRGLLFLLRKELAKAGQEQIAHSLCVLARPGLLLIVEQVFKIGIRQGYRDPLVMLVLFPFRWSAHLFLLHASKITFFRHFPHILGF